MSLTPQEEKILDLYDQGFDAATVSVRLGLAEGNVAKVINHYGNQVAECRQHERSMRIGSLTLLTAILKLRGAL